MADYNRPQYGTRWGQEKANPNWPQKKRAPYIEARKPTPTPATPPAQTAELQFCFQALQRLTLIDESARHLRERLIDRAQTVEDQQTSELLLELAGMLDDLHLKCSEKFKYEPSVQMPDPNRVAYSEALVIGDERWQKLLLHLSSSKVR